MGDEPVQWVLPADIIRKILLECGPFDMVSCRSLCRHWRAAGSGDVFWQSYLAKVVDLTETVDNSLIAEFNEACEYWVNSDDYEEYYLFKPDLVCTKEGFATIKDCDILKHTNDIPSVISEVKKLVRLSKALLAANTMARSEADYDLVPFLLPWDGSKPLDAKSVLKALGAHPLLMKRKWTCAPLLYHEFTADGLTNLSLTVYVEELGDRIAGRLLDFFGEEPLVFYAGSELINPVPYFMLAEVIPGLVCGFTSALIHT